MKKLDYYYDQFNSWAEEYETATMEQKKMIVCQLIKEINVSKGYVLDIVFNLNYQQFLSAWVGISDKYMNVTGTFSFLGKQMAVSTELGKQIL